MQANPLLTQAVERAVEALLGDAAAATVTRADVLHVLSELAQHSAQQGADEALLSLVTLDEAALRLGVTRRRLRALARSLNMGWDVGRGQLILKRDEMRRLAMLMRMKQQPRRNEQQEAGHDSSR